MTASAIVQTQNLSKKYKAFKSVNKVDLRVQEREIYGFLGPNGAGKTTTLKMLLGLIKPSEGTIKMFGESLSKHRPSILKRTGSLIESPSYYGHLTGLENMKVMQRLRNVPDKNVDEALRIVRLENQKNKKAEQYSLGMKQRLGIAMALLSFPKLLILDEPTNGLDPGGIGEIRELIKSLPARYGITVLLSSHLLSEIDQIATSVGIIGEGNLLFQGSMASLRQKGRTSIFLKTGDNAKAERLLLTQGYAPAQSGSRLKFDNLEDTEVADMNRLLVEHNIPVTRIEEQKKSLEDIFLELTGKERSL
ncbi:ATP-binding cassette domain-containing protein [Brevibacillus laterosporus]|uniref:ABC transporter ATP-binding protein n=1 Tax=Brevibacillus laterosporus TaxID=1465 RepID=A0AAP8U2X3_BRELA|nr:ABC transporter ATP-binding protein [Brevibacillus laterosporus]MCR8980895.1 ABC transporter ATP-binding protein [Brevibacillus laterosporus]MCZ0808050.1 ABC transporter ATP-binding protein [Brevibacillus laterosporus]MCZ0828940.1 ABC transporter ATP-binding protein [Brevibacillus laterosporus]MCZ0852478.1 ABC transporter ATP-binding protein [Brevibacillus laterosporus]PPA90193.1 bacitracin ABC transporter ATP-binding protein [Brevibacillus laterosporus]